MNRPSHNDDILIVDDQQSMRLLLAGLLRNLDFVNIRQAASGGKALELIRERLPALLFLDLEMPDMHGLEVLEKLRDTPGGENVFVVIQTGSATRENVDRARELKVNDLLAKPYNAEKLSASIARYRSATAG